MATALFRASGQDHGLHRGRRAMPKPEIIGSVRSTYTRVVCMVCEEKAIQYVLTEKPLRAPEILAIHPFGKMPVLRHGDVELFESKAIATYLDRSFAGPHVFPSDPHMCRSGSRSGGRQHPRSACPMLEIPAIARSRSRSAPMRAVRHRD